MRAPVDPAAQARQVAREEIRRTGPHELLLARSRFVRRTRHLPEPLRLTLFRAVAEAEGVGSSLPAPPWQPDAEELLRIRATIDRLAMRAAQRREAQEAAIPWQ